MSYAIGIDLGGSHHAVGLVNEENKVLDKLEVPTQKPYKINQIIESIARSVNELLTRNNIEKTALKGIGIGIPGTANQETGILEYANNLNILNEPVKSMLEDKLQFPVDFENDANAAAWGEYLYRNKHEKTFMMVTIGTGIGGGIIMNEGIYRGVNFAAGEIGHMSIMAEGRRCNCGRQGCFEEYAATTALIREVKQELIHSYSTNIEVLCQKYNTDINGKIILEAVRQGDWIACKTFERYIGYLAAGIINLINIFQPDVLCIGGGISEAGEQILRPLKERVKKEIYSREAKKQTEIIAAQLGNSAGIIGAANLYRAR